MEGWVWVVMGRVYGWDVLGKAIWAETDPRSLAENILATKSHLDSLGKVVLSEILISIKITPGFGVRNVRR